MLSFGQGSALEPTMEAYRAPLLPLAELRGRLLREEEVELTSKGTEGKGRRRGVNGFVPALKIR